MEFVQPEAKICHILGKIGNPFYLDTFCKFSVSIISSNAFAHKSVDDFLTINIIFLAFLSLCRLPEEDLAASPDFC